jgi:formate hydrogenlyase transcriptional activator
LLQHVANQIAIAVENALAFGQVVDRANRLTEEKLYLQDEIRAEYNFEEIIGESAVLKRILRQVQTVAPTGSTVLIQGETGTGKELIARAIHNLSGRRERTLVKVNCAAIPTGLLESELFGHEKGAFTGAVRAKPGLMEVAGGGTVFLDEIGELPLALQSKLLRALQERQIRRVGGTALVDVNVRVVSATNRDLREQAAKGQFREELYYRINVIEIRLPPLRDRAGDVRLLVHTFLRRYGQGRVTACADDAMEALEAYRWPGNVRELQNVIERACALADGEAITRADLPDHVLHGGRTGERSSGVLPDVRTAGAATDLPLKDAKEQWMGVLEASYLRELLERHGGNITAAAKAAGIDRKTFHRLVTKHGVR